MLYSIADLEASSIPFGRSEYPHAVSDAHDRVIRQAIPARLPERFQRRERLVAALLQHHGVIGSEDADAVVGPSEEFSFARSQPIPPGLLRSPRRLHLRLQNNSGISQRIERQKSFADGEQTLRASAAEVKDMRRRRRVVVAT